MAEFSKASLKADVKALGLTRVPRGKAIRAKCLDCCVGNAAEVNRCHITTCPLWPYRFGKDPFATPRVNNNPVSIAALAGHRRRASV